MAIDPRLIERRKAVVEDRAHRSMSRLLKYLVLLALIGGLAWLAFSPWLSVSQVRTAGIFASDTHGILASHRVIAGTPMVLLRAGEVEKSLLEDPWVAEARVHVSWPDEVIVRIVERVPVAWVQTSGGWDRRSLDGVALPGPIGPDDSLPWVHLPKVSSQGAEESALVLGAVEFLGALSEDVSDETWVRIQDGELWATAKGREVRLGRPVEMEAKAVTLLAMLDEEIPDGAVLVLIAPTHPAVSVVTEDLSDAEDATVGSDGEGAAEGQP